MNRFKQYISTSLCAALILFGFSGCANLSKTEKGAAIGAGAGTVVGGIVGKAVGSTAKGAIVGAVIGGTAGAVIGQQMDKQAEELEAEIANAEIQRVGEGIVVTFDSGLLFDFDSEKLRPEARNNLAELAGSLNEYENTEILIVGHTDAVGAEDYNYTLSERRAEAAAAYVMQQGIQSNRVKTSAKGESEPIESNDTDYGRQQNRRVEVAIFASEEYRDALSERYGE